MLWKKFLYLGVSFAILSKVQIIFAATIANPIVSNTFEGLVNSISTQVMYIVTPFAVVAIIFSGLKFITASYSGSEGELKKAKDMFFWVLIGTAIVVGALVLAQAAVNTAQLL